MGGDVFAGSEIVGDLWASTLWGPLRFREHQATLYTASGLAETLRALLPDVVIEEVPDNAVPQRTWSDGIGAWRWRLAEGPILILPVMADSPAERAGLKAGDRIHSVNGDPEGLLSGPAGTTLTLTVEREGRADLVEVQVTIEEAQEWTGKNFDAYDLLPARRRRQQLVGWQFGLRGFSLSRREVDPTRCGQRPGEQPSGIHPSGRRWKHLGGNG